MMLIVCPHCGPRNNSEFTYQQEVTQRPPGAPTKSEWRRYLYDHTNPAGWVTEQWFHAMGCRRFLRVERHTSTNVIRSVEDVARG